MAYFGRRAGDKPPRRTKPRRSKPPRSDGSGGKKPKPQRVSSETMDLVRLGPNAASFKDSASPGQWRNVVNEAHRRGFTVDSYLDQSVPDPLKQRLRSSLREQAQSTIADAYAPVEQHFSQQEQRAQAVAEKRRIDNERYREWLNARLTQLHAHAAAADQQLMAAGAQIADDRQDAIHDARDDLIAEAGKNPGNVSDPRQADAFDLSAEAEHSADVLSAKRQRTADQIGSSQDKMNTEAAALAAWAAGMEVRRQSELWQQLGEIGDQRAKAEIDKAGAQAEELARLFDQEIDKASANRDYGLAAARLDVSREEIQSENEQALMKHRENTRKHNLDVRKVDAQRENEERRRMEADRDYQLDAEKFGAEQAKDRYQRRHGLGPYAKPGKGGSKGKPRRPSYTERQAVRTITDLADRIGSKDAQDPAKLHGHKVALVDGNNKDGKRYPRVLVEAAAEIAKYGKLRPGTYRKLKHGGAYIPPEWRP